MEAQGTNPVSKKTIPSDHSTWNLLLLFRDKVDNTPKATGRYSREARRRQEKVPGFQERDWSAGPQQRLPHSLHKNLGRGSPPNLEPSKRQQQRYEVNTKTVVLAVFHAFLEISEERLKDMAAGKMTPTNSKRNKRPRSSPKPD